MDRKALIVFARHPEPGKVKTRLVPDLGAQAACDLYEKLLRYTLGVVHDFCRLCPDTAVFVAVSAEEHLEAFRRRFGVPWPVVAQKGEHLGRRMAEAFQELFHRGYGTVVLVGSDLCDLSAKDLRNAFQSLHYRDAVLGPARDGGFYAIGLRRPCPPIFTSPSWGTADVFERTRTSLERLGLPPALLPVRTDIDRPDDLSCLDRHWAFSNPVSVIVPTTAPRAALRPWLQTLQGILWPQDTLCVVHGSSSPPLSENKRANGLVWVESALGRGLQMNAGVRVSPGRILWFLHDDCLPNFAAAYQVRTIARDERFALGCFRLAFSPTNRALNAIAAWANLRTRLFRLPYGDQGMFCRRDTFDAVGGFRRPYLMEDVDFVRSCRPLGRLLVVPDALPTSPRRYLAGGLLKTSLRNHATLFAHFLGVSNAVLYRRYYETAGPRHDHKDS
ncbi:MAG: TIGR04282 family arsenosugar biosynthesis glycosyltransferase [Desulfosoma sp.]